VSGWLRLVLAAQLAFFGLWGAALVRSHADAPAVWLATQPVDPRDLLSGHYVALRYRLSSAAAAGCDTPKTRQPVTVWVRLAETGETVLTDEGPVTLADAVACVREGPPPADGALWMTGRIEPERRRDEIAYGIERFYVAETSPLRDARSGQVVAKIAVGEDGTPRIQALVPIVDGQAR